MTDWGDVPKYPLRGIATGLVVLERGVHVAWAKKSRDGSVTTGFSKVHRVFEHGDTYCLEHIPAADRLVPVLKNFGTCRTCEENYVNGASFAEIVRQSSQEGAA